MPPEEALPAIAKILFWEAGSAAICVAVTRRFQPLVERLALALAFQIVLAGSVAAVLSFAGWNRPEAYLAVAAPLLIAARWWRGPASSGPPAARQALHWFLALFAFTLLLVAAMRPVDELDSLGNLHWMMGWLTNQTTPYEFAFHYVPFWELTYLPGLVLTRSDAFIWLQSLKPVALAGLLLWLIAAELGIARNARILIVAALVAFPHFWLGPSGVSTLKNDMLSAAGQLLAALAVVRAARGRLGRREALLLSLATIFVSVKFSGPVLLGAGAAVCAAACHRWIRANRKAVVLTLGCCATAWLVTVGHYYLRNLVSFANPFYPFQINLGPLHLPGLADLSYSSILHNLDEPRLWRAFFLPDGGISPAGLLFPAVLALILAGGSYLVVRGLLRGRRDIAFALALYQLTIWLVYFRSIYSASGFPGDLQFVLNDLNSIRYVEGALLVAELFVFSLLLRSRLPAAVAYALFAAEGLSRMWLSLRRVPDLPWAAALALAAGMLALAVVRGPKWKAATAALVVFGGLFLGAWRIDALRGGWLVPWQPLYGPVYDSAPKRIYFVIDNDTSQQPCGHLPLMGRRLQHEVITGDWDDLPVPTPPYVVWLRATDADPTRELPGCHIQVNVPAGVLYECTPAPSGIAPAG